MSEYQQCPLCQQTIHADAGAFDFHVNKCLDHSAGSSVASTSTSSSTTSLVQGERCCSVCRVTLDGLRVEDQLAHVQACKSMRRTSATTPSALSQPRAWLKHKTSRPALRLETAPSTCPHCQRDVQHAVGLETHARTCTGSTAPEEEKNNGVEEQHSTFRLGHKQGGSQRNTSQSSTLFSAATTHHPAAAAAEPVPAVYGLLPILQALLEQSHASNSHPSLSSTLCSPHTAHVAVGMSDALYGCGYRCCQMLYSSLRHVPAFASHLASAASFAEEGRAVDGVALPTMKQLQQCIESAWDEGYDPAGRAHFDGRLVHRRKWIGTTELFVLFTYLGLPARIVDFPKSSDALGGSSSSGRAHLNMIRWVTRYFDQASTEQASSKSPETPRKRMAAFDVLMGSKGEACKLGHRQPLFLQHQGHSRVVVGVEKGKSEAETTLLLFDPAIKPKPKVRKAAEAYAAQAQGASKRAKKRQPEADSDGTETEDSDGSARSGERSNKSTGSAVHRWLTSLKADPAHLDLDEHASLLSVHRVSLKQLSKKSQYQLLYIQDDLPPLTPEQRRERRIPTSTTIT